MEIFGRKGSYAVTCTYVHVLRHSVLFMHTFNNVNVPTVHYFLHSCYMNGTHVMSCVRTHTHTYMHIIYIYIYIYYIYIYLFLNIIICLSCNVCVPSPV